MKSLINLFIVFIVILFATNDAKEQKKRRKWCHLNEVMFRCTNPVRVFTSKVNGTGIPIDKRGMDSMCHYQMKLFPDCTRKWLQRCGNDFWLQFGEDLIITPGLDRWSPMCSGPINEKFLKYSPCLHSKVKVSPTYRNDCVRKIQAGFEHIHEKFANTTISNKLRAICCVYNRWENCITGQLLNHCGPVSDEIIVDLIRSATLDLMLQACPMETYNPNGRICADVWEPEDMIPKGIKSNAALSYMFSYFCPNVGFGIVPERDNTNFKF